MTEHEATATEPATTIDSLLPRIRTIAGISALAALAIGILILVVAFLSWYPTLRATLHNLERVSEAMAVSAEALAEISDETALNIAEASVNLNAAAANLDEATANFELNSLNDNLVGAVTQLLQQYEQRDAR